MDVEKTPVNEISDALEAATDDEVFAMMKSLEELTDNSRPAPSSEIFAKIALVETDIEHRYPGQLMAPYKTWKLEKLLVYNDRPLQRCWKQQKP